jgi:hypothetical protein
VQRVLQPAHVATFPLDLLYAVENDGNLDLPDVPEEHEKMAKEIVRRVGSEASAAQFQRLRLSGWNGSFKEGARYCADSIRKSREPDNKEGEVVPLGERKGLWKRYGTARFPELSSVALRLLSIHPTSAATERNWSLWGLSIRLRAML